MKIFFLSLFLTLTMMVGSVRDKVSYRLIYSPVKRVEFDVVMADRTLQLARQIQDVGKGEQAKKAALKGENYMSMLVSDYRTVQYKKLQLPSALRDRIEASYQTHQEIISYLKAHANSADKEVYNQVDYFSKLNYQSFLSLNEK